MKFRLNCCIAAEGMSSFGLDPAFKSLNLCSVYCSMGTKLLVLDFKISNIRRTLRNIQIRAVH